MNELQTLLAGLKNDSMQFHNFSDNKTAFGYDDPAVQALLSYLGYDGKTAFGYDADAMNYNADAMNYSDSNQNMWNNPYAANNWVKQQLSSSNLTTYKARVFYTPGPGPTFNPVTVTFFRGNFNSGTFNTRGDLVFTNTGGDTATIMGLTTPMETLMSITETEPWTLAFIRMNPKSVTQLDNPIQITENTQWNSGKFNEINPDIYLSPDQYQTLRVDVPFNMPIDRKNGFTWDIDVDQTGTGTGLAMFVSNTLSPTKAIQNQPMVRSLGTMTPNRFYQPSAPAGQIRDAIGMRDLSALANHPQVQQMMANHPAIQNLMNNNKAKTLIPLLTGGGAGALGLGGAALGALAPLAPILGPLAATAKGRETLAHLQATISKFAPHLNLHSMFGG